MKQKDQENKKYDWTIAKEYYPEPQSPTDHAEIKRNREGLFPSKTVEMVDKNFIFLSNLSVKESKDATVQYFKEVYLSKDDISKITEISADQIMEKNYMKVKLLNREHCHEFKKKYEKQPFNGNAPRVTVLLGSD